MKIRAQVAIEYLFLTGVMLIIFAITYQSVYNSTKTVQKSISNLQKKIYETAMNVL